MKIQIKEKSNVIAYIELSTIKYNIEHKMNYREIEYLWVDELHRGSGNATKLLKRAIKLGNNLVGLIDPHPKSSLTEEQEMQWLKKYGFTYTKRFDLGKYSGKKNVMVLKINEK
jgi:ribosomal protein S18 acetylase RimI-like enzyme